MYEFANVAIHAHAHLLRLFLAPSSRDSLVRPFVAHFATALANCSSTAFFKNALTVFLAKNHAVAHATLPTTGTLDHASHQTIAAHIDSSIDGAKLQIVYCA